jgi:hypothetical protein
MNVYTPHGVCAAKAALDLARKRYSLRMTEIRLAANDHYRGTANCPPTAAVAPDILLHHRLKNENNCVYGPGNSEGRTKPVPKARR